MDPRRRSLQKRRTQSEYVSKASPLKISFTPSSSVCSTPLSNAQTESPDQSKEDLEPPELARKHTSDANDIYPAGGHDQIETFIDMDPTVNQFSMTPLPSSPQWWEAQARTTAILDHRPDDGSQNVLQSSIDHEVDMSTTSSSIWTTTGILDHLTPPPSRDRGSSNKLAFTRAAQVYESFQIGMETPETPTELILENTATNWNLRDIKRRRTSLENSEVINEPPASASSMAMQSATPEDTMGVIQGIQDDASPESINNLEDELANTSLIEDDQPDLSMALEEPEHNLCPSSVFGVHEQQPQEGVNHTKGKSEEPLRRVGRPAYKSAAKQHAPTVNEMTVVASIVGEVLMETIKASASDSESRAGVKLFKRQAEAIFVEQMNLWSENEELRKDRRAELSKGKQLRAKLLEIRTKRQTVQAKIAHERNIYQANQNNTKESQGLQHLLDGIQSLKARAKKSEASGTSGQDKHRATLQGVVKSLNARCGTIDDDGHRQGGLLQLLRDFNQKLELWNLQLEDEQTCA